MENADAKKPVSEAIRKLYPTLTEAEVKEAEANFRRYIQFAVAVQEEQQQAAGDFDNIPDPITMRERSIDNLKT